MRFAKRPKGARSAAASPRRGGARLGQHFLTGQWAARALAEAAGIRPDEWVLEIGPGKGALTRELIATGGRVLAIEKDESLVQQLEHTFVSEVRAGKLRIICDDIRNFNPTHYGLRATRYTLAANIPYYITGEILRQFLETPTQPRAMALLVQKEVADRIVARDKKESVLSLSVKAYGAPRIVAKVARGNFSPPPSVDSAILLVSGISRTFFANLDEKTFFKVVKAGFASKRKFLSSNLAALSEKNAVLRAFESCGLDRTVRAEDVPLEAWKALVKALI